MIAYHKTQPDTVGAILDTGLKRVSRSEKGDDKWIIEADKLLDIRRPKHLKEAGVSRDNNIYAYFREGDIVIDIKDGARLPVDEFIHSSPEAVLELSIDARRCFVSDIDTYDALKHALQNHDANDTLDTLTSSYWGHVIPLNQYEGQFRRPEIMITYDITPGDIRYIK